MQRQLRQKAAQGDPHRGSITIDSRNRIVGCDRSVAEILGGGAVELNGRSIGEVFVAKDTFGNDLCPDGCWLHEMAKRGETINAFVGEVARPKGRPLRLLIWAVVEQKLSFSDYRIALHLFPDRRQVEDIGDDNDCGSSDLPPVRHGSKVPKLTKRQREILRLVAEGRSTAEVADELSLAISTVHNHQQNALHALGVNHAAAAVAVALRHGLI